MSQPAALNNLADWELKLVSWQLRSTGTSRPIFLIGMISDDEDLAPGTLALAAASTQRLPA